MFNILIVDDDFRDRQGICNTIKKYEIPLLSHTAECGDDALRILKTEKIDILMTDIKMPDMLGIELAETAKKLNSGLIIIIMSAYKDFQYAQSAIGFGAIKYLLKPYSIEELVDTLNNAIGICSRKERNKQKSVQSAAFSATGNMLLNYLNGKSEVSSEEIYAALNTKKIQLVFIRVLNHNLSSDKIYCQLAELFVSEPFIISLQNSEYIILNQSLPNSTGEFFTLVTDLFLNKFNLQICITYSPFVEISLLPEKYKHIRRISEYFFFTDKSLILYTEDIADSNSNDSISIDFLMEKIYFLIEMGNYSEFILSISQLFNTLKQNAHFSSIYAKCISSNIINRLCKKHHIKEIEQKLIEKIFSSNSADEIVALFSELIGQVSDTSNANDTKRLISKCLSLIENEYMNNISLVYIAEKLHISPSYLSRLFKKETGKTFIDYLKEYRLKKACELLINTNLRITEIAKTVGYDSYSYFNTLFSHFYGITPAQYREKGAK